MLLNQVIQVGPTIPLPAPEHISDVFFRFFEVAAISLGALGGALSLRRERRSAFDVIGLLGLGLLSGVGGGIVRDILLGDGPPLALQHPSYLAYALAGAAVAILFGHTVGPRMLAFMNIVDALALGLFTIAGATRALNAHL
ncbi:MAG: TRIC cation channel family protein, partial [Terriglobus sp.]